MDAIKKSDALMREARKYPDLLAQYKFLHDAYVGNSDPAFRVIFGQYLSSTQTFVGDYQGAAESFSIKQSAEGDDRPSPLDNPAYTAQPALSAIPELAKGYRAVFFNEAHNIPRTRTLTVQLLAKLRAEGFNYFAAETINSRDIGLQSRGYPTDNSGFYTEEPIAAEMVRTALKLGYKVIGYDALSDVTGDARQAEQARNIHRQVFKSDPHARLVLDAGYAHIMEEGDFQGGSSMAQYLHRWYGIDILTVEQTMLYGHPAAGDDHPYYAPVMDRLHPNEPLVFIGKDGKPWSLRPGYDVSVWFPPTIIRRGRPTWASLGGERMPYYASGQPCNRHYPCLIEARYANEGDDAIPADRLVLDPVSPDASAGVRASQVRVRVQDRYITPANPDDSGMRTWRHASPTLGLVWSATDNLNLYANAGRGFETPTLAEMAYSRGNAGPNYALSAARSRQWEVGAKWQGAVHHGELAWFDTRSQDEIVPVETIGGRSIFQNVDNVRRRGLELAWRAELGAWSPRASYTYLDAHFGNAYTSAGGAPVAAGNRLPGTARRVAQFALDHTPVPHWRVGGTLSLSARVAANDTNTESAPGYAVASLHTAYELRSAAGGSTRWLLWARIDNLFDRRYAGTLIVNDGNGRYFEPAAGRRWMVGVRGQFL